MVANLTNHRFWLAFLAVVIIAAIVRFWGLGSNPPSLNWDETSLGYNAYSILETGKDEWGKTLPITFRAFGEYKLPGYVYATVPSVAAFGLTEFAVRFPSALFGVLTAGLVFLIIYRLTISVPASLFGGVLLALTPWHFFLSRIAVEANMALFLVVLGLYLFIESIYTNRKKLLIFSMIAFALTLFTYNSARVFMPLFVTALAFIYRKELLQNRAVVLIGLSIFYLSVAVAIPLSFTDSSARYQAVTILDQGAINRINESRGNSSLSPGLQRLLYNKGTYFVFEASRNYLSYFSPSFLFVHGGSQYQFSLPGHGLLYVIELPLIVIGLIYLFRRKRGVFWVLLAWLLLAPIPAAITRETPHVLRSIFMLPSFQILSGVSFFAILSKFSQNHMRRLIWLCVIALIIMVQGGSYFTAYAKEYAKDYSCSWQYGHKQVAQYIAAHKDEYNRIIITKRYGEPHIFMLFYQAIHPSVYNNDLDLNRYKKDNWYWVDQFNGYEFVNDWELQDRLKFLTDTNQGKLLVVTSPGNYPRLVKPFKTITFLDGQPAFDLIAINAFGTKFSANDLMPPQPLRGCY